MKKPQSSRSVLPDAASSSPQATQPTWSRLARVSASICIGLHLLAVISAPAASPPPASDLARWMASWFTPYTQTCFLNHGYRFFAPEPGPSHLIRYELISADGTTLEGRFPDRGVQWPRLLYHRYFMLSEMTFNITSAVPEIPPELDVATVMTPFELVQYKQLQAEARRLHQSLADFLLHQYPQASRVRLYVQTHRIPTPFDIERGVKLTDERGYEQRMLGEFGRSQP